MRLSFFINKQILNLFTNFIQYRTLKKINKKNHFEKMFNYQQITASNQQQKKKASFSSVSHSYSPGFKENSAGSQQIDHFAPYLQRKLAGKRPKVTKSESNRIKNHSKSSSPPLNRFFLNNPSKSSLVVPNGNKHSEDNNPQNNLINPSQSSGSSINYNSSMYSNISHSTNSFHNSQPLIQIQSANAASEKTDTSEHNNSSWVNHRKSESGVYMSKLEKLFDSIATGSNDNPLNRVVEEKLMKYFSADHVYFYYDISSVQLLFCPSSTAICPHGEGLVGYCLYMRKIQNIPCVSQHVSFTEAYDEKYCDPNGSAIIFPLFDSSNSSKAVIAIFRNAEVRPFSETDVKIAEYFQNKFRMYSSWLFRPNISNNDFADLVYVQRIPLFIEALQAKLTRMFNCRCFELWTLNTNTREIFLYNDSSYDPVHIKNSDSGVAGYAMLNLTTLSLTNTNLHSAFSSKSDGNYDSALILPVQDSDSSIIYGLVLRGKRFPNFFTDDDEKILTQISPILINSLNSSLFVEKSFKNLEEAKKTAERLQSLLDVAEVLSGQLHMDTLIESIMSRACDLVKADRCSLFMVNETRDKLITSFHGGLADSIEVPINSGIVGYTATTGKNLNIKDAYEDPRFNRQTDLKTGYKTQNLLCVPIFDDKGKIRGVTEMINKLGDSAFDDEDEKLIQVFNVFVGISIENARLYRASIDLSTQLGSILEISQKLSQTTTLKQILENILKNARKVIGAGIAMIYLKDHVTKRLTVFAIDEDPDCKIEMMNQENGDADSKAKSTETKKALIRTLLSGKPAESQPQGDDGLRYSIAAQVVLDSQPRLDNIRHNESKYKNNPTDKKNTNTSETSVIAVPILDNDKNVLGAALMQWKKKDDSGFNHEDLNLLGSFSIFISISLERSKMLAVANHGEMELELREYLGDTDRQSIDSPPSLTLKPQDMKFVLSKSFNISEFAKIDTNLMMTGFFLFDTLRLRKPFNITNEKLFSFLFSMKETYKKVPYHNWRHAVDVSCFMANMLIHAKLLNGALTHFEILALLVSCLCHDAGHDGYSNEYNEQAQTPLGILFKNQSVMETHHCTVAIHVISKEACNIFYSLDSDELNKMWSTVISLILATDMAKHFDIVKEAENMVERDESWEKSEINRLLVMKLLIKCADISNVARKFDIADQWCDILCEEFFRQGKLEKVKGLKYASSARKREELDKESSQIAFYTSVCLPLFEVTARIFPSLYFYVEQIKSNLAIWKHRTEEK